MRVCIDSRAKLECLKECINCLACIWWLFTFSLPAFFVSVPQLQACHSFYSYPLLIEFSPSNDSISFPLSVWRSQWILMVFSKFIQLYFLFFSRVEGKKKNGRASKARSPQLLTTAIISRLFLYLFFICSFSLSFFFCLILPAPPALYHYRPARLFICVSSTISYFGVRL